MGQTSPADVKRYLHDTACPKAEEHFGKLEREVIANLQELGPVKAAAKIRQVGDTFSARVADALRRLPDQGIAAGREIEQAKPRVAEESGLEWTYDTIINEGHPQGVKRGNALVIAALVDFGLHIRQVRVALGKEEIWNDKSAAPDDSTDFDLAPTVEFLEQPEKS